MLDVQQIREDFPILKREIHGKPLVYFDNAATSQKPRQVIDALTHYYEHYNANIHRGIHLMAEEATEAYEASRRKTVRFIGAKSPKEILFTRNTTEAINLVAYAWGRKNIGRGDEILLTRMEHHSNLVPWFLLAKETGAVINYIEVTPEGLLDFNDLDRHITPRTKLVSLTHMSNVLGTINPVRQIANEAHAKGALVLVDGAQSVPHLPVGVAELDCDFLAFSSHKMLGPTGIGVLYGREALLHEMEPFLGGGEMISQVTFEGANWNELPWKYEAGTPNIADGIAFGAAIDYLESIGMEQIRAHELEITEYALRVLSSVDELTLYGPREAVLRGGVVSFNLAGLHPHDVGQVLDQEGIAVRAGHHCAQPLMRYLKVAATTRASFYLYNTLNEVDRLVEALEKTKRFFSRVVRSARGSL